jgi:catechol 2,3-dioxygenase-like lactoylglutathione lyase family enzyme
MTSIDGGQAPAGVAEIAGVAALAVDSRDPEALANWWQRLLGGRVEVDSDGDVMLHLGAGLDVIFMAVPDEKRGKNRLHLDLRARAYEQAVQQAVALGAVLAPDVYEGDRWTVLRDPEGNEFCILRPRRE